MRYLLLLLWLLPALAQAKPAARGRWGEDPTKVPAYAPEEERRAPKIPDGDHWYAAQEGERRIDSLREGVLVCFNRVADRTNWFWSNHNVAVTFTLRNEPPIRLWAAALHDSSYISVPRVDLAVGDQIAVHIYDRGIFSTKALGSAVRRFDGTFPLVFDLHKIFLECRALTKDEALRGASGRLRLIDDALDQVARQPAANFRTQFLVRADPTLHLEDIRHQFGKLSLRYVAGFLGWEDPMVQERVRRIAELEADRNAGLRAAFTSAMQLLPAPGEWVPSVRKNRRLRVERLVCGRGALDFIVMHDNDDCALLVDLASLDGTPLPCDAGKGYDADFIADGGESVPHPYGGEEVVFDGQDRECVGPGDVVRLALPLDGKPRPRLVQLVLGGTRDLDVLRIPEQP